MPKVFVSAAKDDLKLAHKIVAILEQHHIPAWTSDRLPPGARIDQAIKNAVRDSDVYLVIQGPATMNTFFPRKDDWIDIEWDAIQIMAAKDRTRKVIPIIRKGRKASLLWRDWVPIRLAEPLEAYRFMGDLEQAFAAESTEQDPFTAEERAKKKQTAKNILEAAERME